MHIHLTPTTPIKMIQMPKFPRLACAHGHTVDKPFTEFWKEEEFCFDWLSCLCEFGSIATISAKQLTEFAWGIELLLEAIIDNKYVRILSCSGCEIDSRCAKKLGHEVLKLDISII